MTCIVAIKENNKIYFGGDRINVSGDTKFSASRPKIFIKNEMLIGSCGYPRLSQIFKYNLKIPIDNREDTMEYMCVDFTEALKNTFKNLDESFDHNTYLMIGYKNNIYKIFSNYQVNCAVHEYDSIGSGQDYAMGSLATSAGNPYDRLKLALEVTEKHCTTVCGPFDYLEL